MKGTIAEMKNLLFRVFCWFAVKYAVDCHSSGVLSGLEINRSTLCITVFLFKKRRYKNASKKIRATILIFVLYFIYMGGLARVFTLNRKGFIFLYISFLVFCAFL